MHQTLANHIVMWHIENTLQKYSKVFKLQKWHIPSYANMVSSRNQFLKLSQIEKNMEALKNRWFVVSNSPQPLHKTLRKFNNSTPNNQKQYY